MRYGTTVMAVDSLAQLATSPKSFGKTLRNWESELQREIINAMSFVIMIHQGIIKGNSHKMCRHRIDRNSFIT